MSDRTDELGAEVERLRDEVQYLRVRVETLNYVHVLLIEALLKDKPECEKRFTETVRLLLANPPALGEATDIFRDALLETANRLLNPS